MIFGVFIFEKNSKKFCDYKLKSTKCRSFAETKSIIGKFNVDINMNDCLLYCFS